MTETIGSAGVTAGGTESGGNYRELVKRLVAGESVEPSEITAAIVPLGRGLVALEGDVAMVQHRAELLKAVEAGTAAATRSEEISAEERALRRKRDELGRRHAEALAEIDRDRNKIHDELIGPLHEVRSTGMRAASELANTAEPGLDASEPANFRLTE